MTESLTRIHRLVTRCQSEEGLTIRLRLSQALDTLDWSPPGLAPAAILCIRRLADPLPRAWRTTPASFQPTSAWRACLSKSLELNARCALRPAHEAVGVETNAVLFADYAELLACLALDWCAGTASVRWWWKALFPGLDATRSVRKAWSENPQHVPAALCRLDRVGRSDEFLSALLPSTASQLLENILHTFALTELHSVPMTAPDSPSVSRSASIAIGTKPSAPWSRWIKVDPALPLEPRNLMIICAMLEYAPGVLRSRRFREAFSDWTAGAASGTESLSPHSVSPSPTQNHSTQTLREPEFAESSLAIVQNATAPLTTPEDPIPDRVGMLGDRVSDGAARFARLETPPSNVPHSFVAAPSTHSRDSLTDHLTGTVATHWGGVFYLVNVALGLGLYGDFTTPLQAGLALPVWDFLAMVGRRLIGAGLESDQIWTVLANLSGRENREPPGQWFEPPGEWRIPQDWLAPFVEHSDWRWSAALGRIQIIHPQKFLVADVSVATEQGAQQIEDELRRLGASASKVLRAEPGLCSAPSVEPLERWLGWLVPYIQARLERALGVEWDDPLRDLVFRHRARMEITAARLDVQFELNAHPIELRLAGLDRDPGWIPAAGRTLAFHYD